MIRRALIPCITDTTVAPVWGSGSPQQRSRSAGLPGQYRKPEGCVELLGRNYTISYPLAVFQSGKCLNAWEVPCEPVN